MLSRDSRLPFDTQNCTGIVGNVFERPLAQEGLCSTTFHSSQNLASSSQVLRPDISETARREMNLQSRNGILNHSGGTFSHSGMMDCPRVPIAEWNLGQFHDSMDFQSWKLNFRTEVCKRTVDPQVTMLWIIEVEVAKSNDSLVTSRSITG